MIKSRLLLGIVFVAGVMVLSACGQRGQSDGTVPEGGRDLEVVVFNTPPPTTPTPAPTHTPASSSAADTPTPTVEATATSTPLPALIRAENENPLTGLIVADPSVFTRRPLHVRIGNDSQAQPQINLNQADIVYEEIVEWWITRLTAIYYGEAPTIVAPVRSARLINGQLTEQYHAALVNSGGSDGVRWALSQLPIVNLDEYFHPNPYFYREGEPWQRRLAINLTEAHNYMADEDLEEPIKLRGFAFDPEPPTGDPAETIYIDYPAKESKVLWRYNTGTGEYERSMGGNPHIDGATDQVISSPNVIVYFAEHKETDIVEDSTGATSVDINVNGEGDAWVFRDGVVIKGRWRTNGFETPEFVDAAGDLILLHPGRSWIEVVPTDYDILIDDVPGLAAVPTN